MTNADLLVALNVALAQEGALMAKVIEMLVEVEHRRLHLELACSSMYLFCIRRLGLSEDQAYRRSAAAELARKFPQTLTALRERRVHLSGLIVMKDLLTAENVDELLLRAAGKTKREIEELVADLAPKPDAKSSMRRYPSSHAANSASESPPVIRVVEPSSCLARPTAHAADATSSRTPDVAAPRANSTHSPSALELARIPAGQQVAPLGGERHRIQFTASSALRHKLEKARALMRHRNIDGDLAIVVERAIDLLLTQLEKQKFAAKTAKTATAPTAKTAATAKPATAKPATTMQPPRARKASTATRASASAPLETSSSKPAVPAAVRREVVARDRESCSFVSADGVRCGERGLLEMDHRRARARGGTNEATNLRMYCRAHNHHAAEQTFGREHMRRAIAARRAKQKAITASPSDQPTFAFDTPRGNA